ncbi:ammonium transporter [Caerostris extrusa]|uniref:Ammonium transporter n=1 Tax=Caerostris extrusa TaxID=172846 RepID=A0AAV4MVQ0_CAEEX|nr:ammonium transporter [Caerostris extrusa]
MDRITQVLKHLCEKHRIVIHLLIVLQIAVSFQLINLEVSASSTNSTNTVIGSLDPVTPDDATWILTSSFVIFTMQTGFGLLESGAVTKKNEVNILMKNAADVVLGRSILLDVWIWLPVRQRARNNFFSVASVPSF